jgi:phosphatidylglycerophosphate synthase
VPAVRRGPIVGLIVQIVLLAALAVTVGLSAAAWLTGVGYGLVVCAVLTRGLSGAGASALGPADRVTLTRATLVGGVAALTVDSFDRQVPVRVLVALTVVALVLDAVDGRVARSTGTASALGARFDMEVDAFLILVLSVYVTRPMGGWALAIGAMRYAFVGAAWVLPWMRGALPPRYWRKVVAATQGVVLVFATADVLPRPLTAAALAASLTLLVESFGRDVVWLWHHRPLRPATVTGLDRRGSERKPRRGPRHQQAGRPITGYRIGRVTAASCQISRKHARGRPIAGQPPSGRRGWPHLLTSHR